MAAHISGDSFPTEFNFIENPIIVHIASGYTFPPDSTFRQIVIQVDVNATWNGNTSTYFFYADASAGTDLSVDISSALRGAMKGWEPDASNLIKSYDGAYDCSYPYAKFSAHVWKKYMQDGIVYDNVEVTSRTDAYAYYGGLSNYELLTFDKHAVNFYSGMFFTRKPSTKELHSTGDISTSTVLSSGVVRTHGEVVTSGDFEKGVMQPFLFVNSLGVLETISAMSRESLSYGMESETKNLASAPAYFAKPNRTTHKTGGRGVFKMSSGTVSREWADWWTTEFLMAKKYWMLYDGRWLPVTVTPADDETTIYNRSEQMLPHVDFDVEIAVEGSIMNRVRTT